VLPGDPYHWGVGTPNTRPYICVCIYIYVYITACIICTIRIPYTIYIEYVVYVARVQKISAWETLAATNNYHDGVVGLSHP
jgi:hypothetical protein